MNLKVGYLDKDTWVHRLDPRTKCLWMIIAGTIGFIVPHFGWIALNLALMLPLVLSSKCAKYWFMLVALASIPAWLIAAINMLWGNSVIPSGHIPQNLALGWLYPIITGDPEPYSLFQGRFLYWDIVLTTLSFEKGLYFAFRWVNVVAPGILFMYVTRPENFAASLSQLRIPYAITFVIATAVKFIPVIVRDAQLVYDAQRSRGARIDSGFWPVRMIRMFRLFFPVLISALHHAYNMSIGMEARAFHTKTGRTRFFEKCLDTRDKAAMLYCVVLLGMAIMSRL